MEKLILTNSDFKNLVSDVCRQITISDWRPDYVVGITRGGLAPAVMISHYFNLPMHTLKVSLREGIEDCESNLWMAEDAFGHNMERPKNILLVDDINDTGATFNWIMKDWPSGCLPKDPRWKDVWKQNVRCAVIVNNLASKSKLKMNYVGMEVNKAKKDVWIEFPWETFWMR